MKMPLVLLVDDDHDFCELLAEYLTGEGFDIRAVHDGEQGCIAALDPAIAIIILDVMLPKMNGFEVLKKIKQTTSTPVLMLTAKGDESDQLTGLDIGADDYLQKPCSPKLLLARLRAILRRIDSHTHSIEKIVLDKLTIDLHTRTVTVDHRPLDLTNSEYNILFYLAKEPGKIISKEELSEQCLNRKITPFDRSVDMHMSNLRNKLDAVVDKPLVIRTIRGIGYLLET